MAEETNIHGMHMSKNILLILIAHSSRHLISHCILTLPSDKLRVFLGVQTGWGVLLVVGFDEVAVTRVEGGRLVLLKSHGCNI